MKMDMNKMRIQQQALKTALYFAVFGAAWILITDVLVANTFNEIEQIKFVQMLKGWFYVLAISVIIFFITRNRLFNIKTLVDDMVKSELKFKTYINAAPTGVFLCDEQGNYIDANQSAYKFLGYSKNELLKLNIKDVTYRDDLEIAFEGFSNLKQAGKLVHESRFITKAKKVGWWRIEAVKIDENKYLGFTMDITQQKKLGESLKDRNEFIQTVMDHLPIGIALNEFDSGKTLYMNKQFEYIYGWPKEEIQSFDTFFEKVYPDPEYRHKIKTTVVKDIESGNLDKMKWDNIEITRKNGEKRIIYAANIALPEQNVMISTVMDVTKRNEAEQQLKKYQKNLENIIAEKTSELSKKNEELEEKNSDLMHLNEVFVDREFRIKELKDKVTALEAKLKK